MHKGTCIRKYPVVFGANQQDDKIQDGDYCTPEGSFNISMKYPHKKWSKFMWIDYPNPASTKKFLAAKKSGAIPANATIGGEIGIHGVPNGCNLFIPFRYNWTQGCISMRTQDVNDLYTAVIPGTVVTIIK